MRGGWRRTLLAGLLAVAAQGSMAVIPDMRFRRLDTRDGLSNAQVNCIFRDSRGLVWIGTPYGLNRYDGYRIKTYLPHSSDTTSLLRGYVDEMMEDGDGRLWLRQGTDYAVYDPVTACFDNHPERWLSARGVSGTVERLYIDDQKNFWVKTYDQGMWQLNPRTGQLHHYDFGSGRQQIDEDFGVSDFAEYGKSLLMVSCNGDIICFNKERRWVSWKSHTLRRLGRPQNVSYQLRVDPLRNLWALCNGRAYVYVRQKGRWSASAPEALHWMGLDVEDTDYQIIWDVATDAHGQLWLATDHTGLNIVNLERRESRRFLTKKGDETTISDNTLSSIYRDQLGRMWISTYKNGVNYYSESLFNFNSISTGNVNTVCVDGQGDYWLGTNDQGIIRYRPSTGESVLYNKVNSGLGTDIIVSSLAASDGTLWFGTYEGGLIHYANGRFTTYKVTGQPQSLAHNSVWALCEDRQGNVWLGTLGGGLQRIDRQTGLYTTLNAHNSALCSNYISSIQLTRDGWLLVGHTEYYSLVHPVTMQVKNCRIPYPSGEQPLVTTSNQVVEDSRGLIWQCTTAGVAVYDTERNRTDLLDMKAGLPGATVNGIVEDRLHGMWLVTDHGVSNVILRRQDNQWTYGVQSYNNRDGLQDGPYNQRSMMCTDEGLLVVGGLSGIDIIRPQAMKRQRTEETPLLTDLLVGSQLVRPGQEYNGHQILKQSIGETRKLRLRYTENHFTVYFATNSGEVHNRTRFAYQMKGLSNDWIHADEQRPQATFTGLPSGSYTLRVRMLNDDGTLGSHERVLSLTVDAPWYRSWWMWMVYLLVTATAVGYLYRRVQEKVRLEQRKMEREQLDVLRQKFYDTVSDELRLPFQQTFESLNTMMQEESDEQRYEREQQVFGHVEQLLEQVNKMTTGDTGQAKLLPQIREMEITSLDQKLINDATAYVEENLSNAEITVEAMAEALNMSRVHLYKKLTAISGLSPSEFIRQIRLRYAEQLLAKSQLTVAEVAYKVGFNNPRYFSKYFKEMYGKMPSELKKKGK